MGDFYRVGDSGFGSGIATQAELTAAVKQSWENRRGSSKLAVTFRGGEMASDDNSVRQVTARDAVREDFDPSVWSTPSGAPIIGREVRNDDLVRIDGMPMKLGLARSLGLVSKG
jgi:hypothetical protein